MNRKAGQLIESLGLRPHPEGGYFRETWRSNLTATLQSGHGGPEGSRSIGTAIYYLLSGDEVSRLHRLKADEVWHLYSGGPLTLHLLDDRSGCRSLQLGDHTAEGPVFQTTVPAGCWFGASLPVADSFALAGCTLAPGYDHADFELGDRTHLLRQFPDHEKIIRLLT
jgi:predicted cupin superfamily sugar epimerase